MHRPINRRTVSARIAWIERRRFTAEAEWNAALQRSVSDQMRKRRGEVWAAMAAATRVPRA
jgi:hypothetical protein